MLYVSDFSLPSDFQTNFLMLLRLIHFIAGIIWIGLLYFFNLVNIPFMKELDPATRAKITPGLMLRALHWFRWSALVTVLAGLAYWGSIVGSDARNGGGSVALPMWLGPRPSFRDNHRPLGTLLLARKRQAVGEQSPVGHRHRRRHRLDDAA
jgi:hypothetical protein